ncbi:substrate-binding domain-containing protein [Mesorhizobium sp. M1409]|uniref:substrate-binding domain-containing protein n=1 Tax=unclassified Mesorhizobium TaxID=325217 RepID=UPI0033374A83
MDRSRCEPESGRSRMTDDRLRFRLITIASDEELFHVVKRGMRDAAAALSVDADLVGTPGFDIEDVVCLVRSAIHDGIDGIGLNVFHPTALAGVIAEAEAAGIPVVAFNIDAAKTGSGNLSYIMQDFLAAGTVLGHRAAASVADGEHVIVAMHDEGVGALEERAAGIEAGLASRSVVVTRVITGRAPARGAEILDAALVRLGAHAIIGTGQPDTEAAGIVVRASRKHGLYAAGFDLSPGIVDLIAEGHLDCVVDQQPYAQGFYPTVQLTLYRRFGLMPSSLDAGAAIVDRQNVELVRQLSKQSIR